MFKKKIVENSKRKNMFKTVIEESGTIEWNKDKGETRMAIIDIAGKEYNQINILASILAEIVKETPDLLNNDIISEGLSIFNEINKIRGR